SCFGRDERISINGKILLPFVTQLPFYIRRTAKRKRPLPYFSSAAGTCSRKHGIFRRAVFLYQLPQAGQVPSDQAALKEGSRGSMPGFAEGQSLPCFYMIF
ncbi:hypothetical protein, partial [Bacillus licheniformis]